MTYTETNAQYNVQFTENCEMVLSGINNDRILYYSATSNISDKKTDTKKNETDKNSVNSNSSEIKK